MLQRIIPSSGESIPAVGIGSWIQFDIDKDKTERGELKKVLTTMHSHHGSVIDSSPMYGRAEQVIGELTNETGLADQFFYATKVWTSGKEAGIRQMKESMQKMGRSTMDLMQIHNLVDWQTHLETLRQWKNQGIIRYYGITHYTSSSHVQLAEIIKKQPMDFVQFNYSIGTRNAEQKLLPLAMEKEVAVLINEPLEKGRLFERVKNKALPAWAGEYGIRSWAVFFLKYILSHPGVTCIIPATSDSRHAEENFTAGEGEMPDEKGRRRMADFFDQL